MSRYEFIITLLRICWDSSFCGSLALIEFGKLSVIISLIIVSAFFSLFYPSETPNKNFLTFFTVFHVSLLLFYTLLLSIFLRYVLDHLSSTLLVLSSALSNLLPSSMIEFQVQLLDFSFLKVRFCSHLILLGAFYGVLFPAEICKITLLTFCCSPPEIQILTYPYPYSKPGGKTQLLSKTLTGQLLWELKAFSSSNHLVFTQQKTY